MQSRVYVHMLIGGSYVGCRLPVCGTTESACGAIGSYFLMGRVVW